jgi:hypothetical protein
LTHARTYGCILGITIRIYIYIIRIYCSCTKLYIDANPRTDQRRIDKTAKTGIGSIMFTYMYIIRIGFTRTRGGDDDYRISWVHSSVGGDLYVYTVIATYNIIRANTIYVLVTYVYYTAGPMVPFMYVYNCRVQHIHYSTRRRRKFPLARGISIIFLSSHNEPRAPCSRDEKTSFVFYLFTFFTHRTRHLRRIFHEINKCR